MLSQAVWLWIHFFEMEKKMGCKGNSCMHTTAECRSGCSDVFIDSTVSFIVSKVMCLHECDYTVMFTEIYLSTNE